MDETFRRRRATELWQEGQLRHLEGELEQAVSLYTRSIDVLPTAEAYTFRGWAYSYDDRLDEAIAECKKAIDCDASLGNPYNDIGSYLMKLNRLDEAIPWLEKATEAARYEAPHFPRMNLGRIYASKNWVLRAMHEFEAALALAPGDETCLNALADLRERLQ